MNSGQLLSWEPRQHGSQLGVTVPVGDSVPGPLGQGSLQGTTGLTSPILSTLRCHNFQVKSRICVDFSLL